MEFKGTKGEWDIKHSESKDAFNIVGTVVGGHYKIARIPYLVTESLIEVNRREKLEAQYNSKLISKAPELLELLNQFLEISDELSVPDHLIETFANLYANSFNTIQEATTI